MNRNNANGMIELWQKATFSSIMISGFSGGGGNEKMQSFASFHLEKSDSFF